MLTYAHVCSRMLTYAERMTERMTERMLNVCGTYADVCSRMQGSRESTQESPRHVRGNRERGPLGARRHACGTRGPRSRFTDTDTDTGTTREGATDLESRSLAGARKLGAGRDLCPARRQLAPSPAVCVCVFLCLGLGLGLGLCVCVRVCVRAR
jgi:hypothetical protein